MTHLDLRAATAKQVQQLRFVEFEQWFPLRRDERASEGFYTPLQEDFYNVYLNSGAIFRSQRVCNIESIVAAAGEHIRPYLSYLPGLIYLDGQDCMFHLGSISSMLLSRLTRSTDSYTLHLVVEITG